MVYKFFVFFHAGSGNDSPDVFDKEGSLPTNRVQSYTKTEGHLFTPLIFNVIWE